MWLNENWDRAQGTGTFIKIIQALKTRNSCKTQKLASAKSASLRLLTNTQKTGMISNLLYLVNEFKASSCEPDVQARLAAKAARIPKIIRAVDCLLNTEGAKSARGSFPRSKKINVPINNATLAKLRKPIGRPTDAASAQTSRSLKLMVFLNKIVGRVCRSVEALSAIRSLALGAESWLVCYAFTKRILQLAAVSVFCFPW